MVRITGSSIPKPTCWTRFRTPPLRLKQVAQSAGSADDPQSYANWIKLYDTISDDDRDAMGKAISEMAERPLISVVMPVYNTPEAYLRAAIILVSQQLYPNWELCIADDASTAPQFDLILEHYRVLDERIKVCYRDKNGHISAASNSAFGVGDRQFCRLARS